MNFDHSKIDAIIAAVVQLPSPEERSDFLERACGGNHALRMRLEVLLAAQQPILSAVDEREPPEVTAPPPILPVAQPPEITVPPPIAYTPRNPRKRSSNPAPRATSKLVESPAMVLTAIGAVAVCAVIMAFVWMSRSRQQTRSRAESPAAVARGDRSVSSIQSSELQSRVVQAPALQPQVNVHGTTDQFSSGGTTVRHNPRGTVVTGADTTGVEPTPRGTTLGTTTGSGNLATPPGSVAGESDAVVPKGFPVEIPGDAKVISKSEASETSNKRSIKSSMMFTSSKSIFELDSFFIDRLRKRGYEITFDGLTNGEEGPEGVLHARRRDNTRDVVMITYATEGRKSSVQLVWEIGR